jgi:hypothetical protein
MMGDIHFSNNTPESDVSQGVQLVPEPEGNISAEYCTQTHREKERGSGVRTGKTSE